MKIEEDRMFLQRQREPGRPGHLGGVDKKTDRQRGKGATSSCQRRKSANQIFSALSAQKSKEERLNTVISYGLKKQLIAVPRLDNSTGKEQAQAISKTILD
ncbi:hypothetical protein AVEN_165446-1 [Araneus ventricosus]|uniref:Uncharacterized protein n=1 Tax=Araneus ventricosus TaxID=182803 RepID=A0A4Y2HVY2_ARAVE|nr:hypothetical protein AVEN_165446-1 [Araneus ventricosus]